MKYPSIFLGTTIFLIFGFFVQFVSAQTINNNLTLGSKGEEVSTLQKFLVAEGYLSMPLGVSYGYFGLLTRKAVANWQENNGVSPALGYFGPISRSVFNKNATSIEAGSASSVPIPASIPVPVSLPTSPQQNLTSNDNEDSPRALGMMANRISLFRASPFEVRSGDTISLDGSGFSKTLNKVYFNGGNSVTTTSANGAIMDVVVPSLSNGEYELSVENVFGSSANPDIKIKIKVTDNPEPPPQITSASISGDTVTLLGTGFTSSNKIFTTFGDSSGSISSNGTSLSFSLSSLSRYNQVKKFTLGNYQAILFIFVQNEHGMNKEPYQLNLNI